MAGIPIQNISTEQDAITVQQGSKTGITEGSKRRNQESYEQETKS
jgi:hypothetical protein